MKKGKTELREAFTKEDFKNMCFIYNIKTVDEKDIDFMFENAERDEVGDTSCAAFIQEYRS